MYSYLKDLVETKEFVRVGKKTTICILTLKTGFEVVGTSAVVKEEHYNETIGNREAENNAYYILSHLDGYAKHLTNKK